MSTPTTKTEHEYCRKYCPERLGWDDGKRAECRAKTACEPFRELFRTGEAKGMSASDTPRTDAELERELAAIAQERDDAMERANRALYETTSALALVARIRAALGDHGTRMQDELIEYCRELARDRERLAREIEGIARVIEDSPYYGRVTESGPVGMLTQVAVAARAAIDSAREGGR